MAKKKRAARVAAPVVDSVAEELLEVEESTGEDLGQETVAIDGVDDEVTSATISTRYNDRVKVWDRETGEESLVLKYMLPSILKKTRDGVRVFTTRQPDVRPKMGNIKCFLHPDDPNRGLYDEMGLPVCMKYNIKNPHQRIRHMQKKHRDEWAAIENIRTEAEKEEEREERRLMREALTKSKE